MVPERDVDCGDVYERARRDLVELLQSLDPDQLDARVPATPEWSVHDVLAHLVGIDADLNAGVFGPDAYTWTAVQVRSRRERTIAELAEEWEREGPQFQAGLRLFDYEFGSHYIGDLLQHAADIRHALGIAPPPDDQTLAVALDFYLTSFEETLESAGLGAVEVSVGDEHWTLGTGATIASVSAGRFPLFRSLGGRRTLDQIRALRWDGDVETIVPLVSRYPVPQEPIIEAD